MTVSAEYRDPPFGEIGAELSWINWFSSGSVVLSMP